MQLTGFTRGTRKKIVNYNLTYGIKNNNTAMIQKVVSKLSLILTLTIKHTTYPHPPPPLQCSSAMDLDLTPSPSFIVYVARAKLIEIETTTLMCSDEHTFLNSKSHRDILESCVYNSIWYINTIRNGIKVLNVQYIYDLCVTSTPIPVNICRNYSTCLQKSRNWQRTHWK